MKKEVLLLAIIFSSIFFFDISTANFACGEVNVLEGNISPSWLKVEMNYLENPNFKTHCEISPADNRYCCDPLDIKNVSWKIGKNVSAQIKEYDYNLFANPVNLTITGAGFDVFPDLDVKRIYEIHSPNIRYLIGTDSILFNISTNYPFSPFSYRLNQGNSINLCGNCSKEEFLLSNLSQGTHNVSLYFSDGINTIEKNLSFFLIDYLYIQRNFSCQGCNGNYIPSNREVKISLFINSSIPLSGKLIEKYPGDWISNQIINIYDPEFNIIIFDIENISFFNYALTSPDINLPYDYFFSSSLETLNYSMETQTVTVAPRKFFKWLSFATSILSTTYQKKELFNKDYVFVDQDRPILAKVKTNETNIESVTLFFNGTSSGNLNIFQIPLKSKQTKRYNLKNGELFFIGSTIKNFSHISINFKVPVIKNNDALINFSIYHNKNGRFILTNFSKVSNDSLFEYYSTTVNKIGMFRTEENYG